ncbi:MAG: hypothetical protein ACLQO7_09235 [Candidatus Bathyarchaeia archaeon]
MAKTVMTEQEKRDLKIIAIELLEIRKLVDELAESLVNLSDKELLKLCNANQDNEIKEKQVDKYKEKLEKQLDIAEKEFR